jgi:4-amino-4-deoxy-L-arabinose transferase-like glycosyltransferase
VTETLTSEVRADGREPPAPEAPSSSRSFRLALLAIVAAGVLFRVGYVVVVKGDPPDTCGQELCGDAVYYATQAKRLSDGELFTQPPPRGELVIEGVEVPQLAAGEPVADHPPLTSIVVAPANLIVDGSFVQRLVMALVGGGVIALIGLLGRQVGGDRVGLLSAGLAAVYPNLWMNDVVVMAEALTALLVAGVLLATYRYRERPDPIHAVVAGGLVGLAALARSEQLLLLPVIVVPMMVTLRDQALRKRLGRVGLAALGTLVVVAPWVLFNLARFDEPVTLSTNDGLTLLGANCDDVYSGSSTGFWSLRCGLSVRAEGDASVQSRAQRDAAFDYLADHERDLPRVMLLRAARAWSFYAPDQMAWLNQGEGRERWASWAGFWTYIALLPLAVVGAFVLHRRRVPVWPLVGTAVIVTLTAALFYGIVRFRVPAEVAIVVLAAATLDAAWARWRPSPATTASVA